MHVDVSAADARAPHFRHGPSDLSTLLRQDDPPDPSERPVLYRLSDPSQAASLESLLRTAPQTRIVDRLYLQLCDLLRLEHPTVALSDEDLRRAIVRKLAGTGIQAYGAWAYFPWKGELVHILDEAEFVKTRTVRNRYKIDAAEQAILQTKRIGIVGLSVGATAAVAAALERIAGHLKLADFDHLDLSNMNRIRCSVGELGLPKSTIVAREIAELDPYLAVETFGRGIDASNIDAFLLEGGRLDAVIDECDSLEIKLLLRERCKALRIPVLSETSDRFMIDIERFDLDPDLPVFHGLMSPRAQGDLRTEGARLRALAQIVELPQFSARGATSIAQIGASITTWPQLGTDVMAGGALLIQLLRHLLLGAELPSGRGRFDPLEHYRREIASFNERRQPSNRAPL